MTLRRIILILVVAALAAANIANAAVSQSTSKMLVQTSWLAAHLDDPELVILYVGASKVSYDAGHIPGARFMPLSDVAATRNGIPNQLPSIEALKTSFEQAGVDNKSRVVLYGDISGLFAARAYLALDYLGHGNHAALLDGGFEKWKAEHLNVSTAVPAATVGRLNVKARPEIVVGLATMRQLVANKKTALIDARPPDEYSGVRPGDSVTRGGHIPGAKNVFWMDNLISRGNPILKPASEMQNKYAAAGVKRGAKLVVYCRTGFQASHDYFTLKLLGFSPVLYEGSFLEWSNAPGTPIDKGM